MVIIIANIRLLGAVPVSYTHLDVYKRQFYDSLENAEGPLVISAGTTPVIIQGRSGQELPVGIEIKRGNIELKDVNVNVSGADLLADADGAAAGIYVSVTGENAVLDVYKRQ